MEKTMKSRRCILVKRFLSGLLLMSFLSGCAVFQDRPANRFGDHAFIVYWPPPEHSGRLRLAVKDLIDMKGLVTTAGSEYLAKTSAPALKDAACMAIARERNVEIVGKTNLSEFALGVSGMNSWFGTPKNRLLRHHRLIAGGSSSGAAVAIQDGKADVSFGTDSAGSIRVPAACCGVFGLKTTYGLVPLKGVFPISPKHLDTIGPLAKDIPHLVEGMDLLQEGSAQRYRQAVARNPSARSLKIGRLYLGGTDPAIDKALDDALAAKHFQVVRLSAKFQAQWVKAQEDGNTVAIADAWLHDRKYSDKSGVAATTKAVISLGDLQFRNTFKNALKDRPAWRRSLKNVFKKVDFIALPTLQQLPPRVPFFGVSPLLEAQVLAMQNTVGVNFAGNPAIAIPVPMEKKGVPFTSLQLVGPPLSEPALMNAGRLMESGH